MVCDPAASVATMMVWPADSVPVPIVAPSADNCTLPVGVPVPELVLTRTVNVTACPVAPGLWSAEIEICTCPATVTEAEVLPLKLLSPW